MRLRPYQEEAVEAVLAARREGVRRMVLALPTGAGKTVVFSELIRRARHDVLVLAHRDELVRQAEAKIRAALSGSGRTVAIEQAERRAPREANVVVASIRSLHGERLGRVVAGRSIRLIIYDECHHAVAPENLRVLRDMGAFQPDWPGTLVGCTATTRRADGRGLDEVFERIVYERSLRQMIEDGYLRPLRGIRIDTRVRVTRIPGDGDDLGASELDDQIDVEERNLLVARSIQELARDRRTIAFCGSVRHASNLCARLNELGVRSGIVCGDMPKHERSRTLRRFREGRLQVVTNVGVLTEGFDDPDVSAIAMVRPTRSESLYLQCVGRGMRPSPAAPDCLVLDFVDLSDLEVMTTHTLDAGPSRVRELPAADEAPGMGDAWLPIEDVDEVPATLQDIQQRMAAFDPLTLTQLEEAAAISPNAWLSLGARGMMLHFLDHRGRLQTFELQPAAPPRRGTFVKFGDRTLGRFSTMHDAVAAVDVELPRYGDPASARPGATWRREPVSPELGTAVAALRPPRIARDVGEALAHLSLAEALAEAPRQSPRRGRATEPTRGRPDA